MSLSTWETYIIHLVHPALNLSILDAGATSKFDDVLLDHGVLPHVLPLAVQQEFFWWTSRGDHSIGCSSSLSFVLGPLLHT